MRLSLFALLVLLIAGTGEPQDPGQDLGPQAPPYRPDLPIAIVGGLLIDATGAPPRLDHAVIIEGERITRVGPMDEVAIPEGAQVIDAAGMTIMPGLINSNQHIQLNPMYPNHRFFAYPAETVSLTLAALKARWEYTFAKMPQRSFVYLMQGVTSQRHTSGPLARLLPVKKAIDEGKIPGPRLFPGRGTLSKPRWASKNSSKRRRLPKRRLAGCATSLLSTSSPIPIAIPRPTLVLIFTTGSW